MFGTGLCGLEDHHSAKRERNQGNILTRTKVRILLGLRNLGARAGDLDQYGRNGSKGENIVRAGGCDFDGTFHMLPTFNFAEVEFLFCGSGIGPAVG
jgi:hypothetical protein